MCSKREELEENQENQEDQENQEQGGHNQDFQNPSPTFQERVQENQIIVNNQIQLHQNYMGGSSNDYSYLQPQQQPWNMNNMSILPQVFHNHSAGVYTPADLVFPAADHSAYSAYVFPPPPPTTSYGGLINRRVGGGALQFAYEGSTSSSDHNLRLISETLGQMVQPAAVAGCMPFGLQAEMGKMTAQEIMDAKALAASKSHSEAERRRRERINNHLAKLRSLLPSTTKTDKASLLAEVIQHVKELKRQTSIIAEQSPVPTETDELTIDNASDEQGNLVIRASLCCDDRSDLLPDIINTLKSLRLRTLKAEITTLGGRMRNVLFIAADQPQAANTTTAAVTTTVATAADHSSNCSSSISAIQEAFRAVIDKTNGENNESSGSVKRQRTNSAVVLDHHHHRRT